MRVKGKSLTLHRKTETEVIEEITLKERYNFPKDDRLHHRSLVEGLFRKGKSFYEFPFRVTWRIINHVELEKNFRNHIPERIGPLQMMVTVPKKKRRHAVDRVLLRRRIREAYRLNHGDLKLAVAQRSQIRTMGIAFIYIHDKNLPYATIETKMKGIMDRLLRIVEKLEKWEIETEGSK